MATPRRTNIGALAPAVAAAVLSLAFSALGGGSWLSSPAIWGAVAFAAVVLLVVTLVWRRPLRLLVALPVVIGGALAVVAGAWDYVPWLTSPLLWLGAAGSAATGLVLVRSGRATARDAVEGLALGPVVFGLGLLAVFVGIVFFWVVWRPFGVV
jgi:hypothetical protein